MASWKDVDAIASILPRAKPGLAHDGESPTRDVGRHPFARLRWADGEGREILQFWNLGPERPARWSSPSQPR